MLNLNECKIVFFNSPIYEYSINDKEDYLPPLGQGYIVTHLKKEGINAAIVDCVHEHIGVKETVSIINEGNFPCVAFNVFSINVKVVEKIVLGTKRTVKWFLGGKALEFLWPSMLHWNWKNNEVIYTIGECDIIYVDLILNRCKEKPIYYQNNQYVYCVDKYSVYYPKDLNSIFLDRNLFRDRFVINHYGKLEYPLIASRGCVYNCAFCGGARYANANTTVRERSFDSIVAEIKEIIDINHRVQSIRMLDDLFLQNRHSLLQAIKVFNSFPNIYWRCMAHVRSLKHHDDLFEKLRESGCDELFIGIESGSLQIREMIHKEGAIEDVKWVVSNLLKEGIDVKGYFICGFPGETGEQMQETVFLADELKHMSKEFVGNFRAVAFQFRPYHGTELYDRLVEKGRVVDGYHFECNSSTKIQCSFVAENYSDADELFLKQCIQKIGDVL